MAIKKRKPDAGVGEVIQQPVTCGRCGGEANIPAPVLNRGEHRRYGSQKWLPDPGGAMLCWGCYQK